VDDGIWCFIYKLRVGASTQAGVSTSATLSFFVRTVQRDYPTWISPGLHFYYDNIAK
jgi:triacylglycerol esterase/lipase EstA (alpha/beta hydrolase family)